MNSVRHAMRIAKRYAEGGSDDDVPPGGTPPGPQLGPHLGHILQTQPLSPDQPSPSHNAMHAPYMPMPRGEPPPAPAPVVPKEEAQAATKPAPQTSVEHWSQAIADHLVSRHGDDYPAAEEAIRDIGTNYSQRAANAVWEKMPLEHQMGMMDARMQDDLGPAAYRMATDPANWKVEADRKLATNYQPTEGLQRVPPEQQAAEQQGWDEVLSRPTTEQDRQEARGWLGELLRRNAAANSLPEGYTIQPGAAGLTNVMHPNGHIHAQGMTQEDAIANAIQLGHRDNNPDFANIPVPVRTAPPQGASRSGYVSPYGIHSQQQEPPEPTSEEDYGATEWGHEYHGEVPRESHPFFDATKKAMDDFQTTMQPKVGDINEFAKEFFAGYDTRGINFANEHGDMSWDGTLMDKGKPVGDFSISINSATNSAHLGLMELDRNYRGVAGPKLLRNQIDMYKKMGLDYVDLYAAGGGDPYGGSYAWAKYGFTPNQEDWDLMRRRFTQRLNSESFRPADSEAAFYVKNILGDADPRAIWELSDVTAPTANGKPAGKTLLLSTGWSGSLTFKDTAAMERFDAYLKRPKKTKPAD